MDKINLLKPKLHLFVCCNQRPPGHPTPSCSPRISEQDVTDVKHWIIQNGLSTQVYCTKTKCLGFCNQESSVVCLYPSGNFYKINSTKDLKELITNNF